MGGFKKGVLAPRLVEWLFAAECGLDHSDYFPPGPGVLTKAYPHGHTQERSGMHPLSNRLNFPEEWSGGAKASRQRTMPRAVATAGTRVFPT